MPTMPMIETDLIKPASDAAQKAFDDWKAAGDRQSFLERNRPTDGEGIRRAIAASKAGEWHYDQECRNLAMLVARVITKAENTTSE